MGRKAVLLFSSSIAKCHYLPGCTTKHLTHLEEKGMLLSFRVLQGRQAAGKRPAGGGPPLVAAADDDTAVGRGG